MQKGIYFASYSKISDMDLKMLIGNTLIDTININEAQLAKPGCVEFLKMEMEEKNEEIIDLSNEEPQFYIDAVPSSMNRRNLLCPSIN
jgi:hypothetical protein